MMSHAHMMISLYSCSNFNMSCILTCTAVIDLFAIDGQVQNVAASRNKVTINETNKIKFYVPHVTKGEIPSAFLGFITFNLSCMHN